MSSATITQSNSPTSGATWLYKPWIDLVFGCGAWSAPLLLLSYLSSSSHALGWSFAFYALALVFNYPHYMATIYRAYHRAEDFRRYRFFTVYTTAIILLTGLLSHFWIAILPWIFTLYLTWSPWHYTGQNYGVFMMFARRAGADISKSERHALYGAFIASYLLLFLSFHTGVSSDSLFISLNIPGQGARFAEITLCVAFFVLSAFALSALVRTIGWRRLTPCLTLFSSQILWFLLPVAITLLKHVEIPQSRYSSGVLAVMHSAQYLWITSFYASREAKQSLRKTWQPLAYFAVLIAGGIALFVPGPWLASRFFHHDFTASFLIFTALVNLHHFILDGAIWKLRDGRIASLLLNSKVRVGNATSEARGWAWRVWNWATGGSSGAQGVRISAAVLLLAFGIVDQARYYFVLHSENVRDLQRAALLNSFDGPTQMHLAEQELSAGHPQQAEAAWKMAIQSNPADPAPRESLLRFLLTQNRFDEAYDLTKASLTYAPKDPSLWVDYGLLALQHGDSALAIECWKRAIALDPHQMLAHLYLAGELDHAGKPESAIVQYRIFLSAVARQPAAKRPEADKLIAVVLRMADCQARTSQPDEAIQSYALAARLAAETKQPKLESIASVDEAELQASAGKRDLALPLYQRAIQLDDSIDDHASSAADWLAYARFLNASGFPSRLVYACLLKSASQKDSLSDATQREYLTDLTEQTARKLGSAASPIRRDPGATLREALTVR